MKKLILNKILLGFLTIMTMNCYSQSDFIKASNEIYKRAIKNNNNKEFKKAARIDNKIRKEIIRKGDISFFDYSEPLLILEGYDLETDDYYTEIWNSKGFIGYDRNKKNYTENKESHYSEDLKLLVNDWRIETIKKNMKEKGLDLGGYDFYATAIYFSENGEIDETKKFSFSQYDGCLREIIIYEQN